MSALNDIKDVALSVIYGKESDPFAHLNKGESVNVADIFKQWAIVELMGRVRVAGLVTEEERFGSKLGRVDIPQPDGSMVTQYFGGASVYRLTPCTEEIARGVSSMKHVPIQEWDIKRIAANVAEQNDDDDQGNGYGGFFND